jgi:hypothetical protein
LAGAGGGTIFAGMLSAGGGTIFAGALAATVAGAGGVGALTGGGGGALTSDLAAVGRAATGRGGGRTDTGAGVASALCTVMRKRKRPMRISSVAETACSAMASPLTSVPSSSS